MGSDEDEFETPAIHNSASTHRPIVIELTRCEYNKAKREENEVVLHRFTSIISAGWLQSFN